jgi:triose/dihydroxyacetone kinase / FAD-AMP lyase (cyclizing)
LKNLELSKPTSDAAVLMHRIIQVVENTMDGTSGAIYAIFLNALAHGLRSQDSSTPENVTVGMWAKALESSMVSLGRYTPARPGDRTLVDSLYPFVGTLSKTGSMQKAAEAAQEGAQKTKGMKASLGRAVYVGGEGWRDVPDPGAHGLSEFLQGLNEGLK